MVLTGSQDRDLLVAGAAGVVAALSLTAAFALRPPNNEGRLTVPIARLARASGTIHVRPASTLGWKDAPLGFEVREGDALFVPPGAAATVTFDDGTELGIDERTLVVIELPKPSGAQSVALRQGSLSGRAGAGGLTVATAEANARLERQTEATLELKGKGELAVAVRSGAAVVTSRGSTKSLKGSQRAETDAKAITELPAWPMTLLTPAPQAHFMFRAAPEPVELTWAGAAPPGAKLQLAHDRLFAFLDEERALHGTRDRLETPRKGVTWWRLVDAAGLPVSESRRFSVVEDVAPAALFPRNGEVVFAPKGATIGLSWTPLPGVTRYRLELAPSESFETIVRSQPVEGTSVRAPLDLDEATWFWRVRADDESGSSAPSAPLRFRVIHKGIPDAPELLNPEIEVTP